MTIQQFLLILRARYLVALITLLVTVTAVVGYSLMLPKEYSATTSVVVDSKAADLLTGMSVQGPVSAGVMSTQIDIIRSARVAKEVVKMLRLDENPIMKERWRESTQGKGQLVDWMASAMQRNLEAMPSRESSVINISYSAPDPEFAALVANAFAQGYINVNLDLRVTPARQYASFFETQAKEARLKLEAAQKKLSDYQQVNGITSVDERLDFETAKLNETSSQLTMIQGMTTDSQSKRQNARLDTVFEVIQNPLLNELKADMARLEVKLSESNSNLGSAHPDTLRLQAQLATIKSKLEAETRKIGSSIDTSFQVGKQREQQLQSAVAAQKVRVLQLNKQRDELNVLRRDVESAQRSYDMVTQRAAQTSIEGQVNQANIAILNPATPPASASKPRVLVNAMAAVFLGTILGIGLAVILELLKRRVRSTEDIADVLEMPLLGSVGSASGMLALTHKGGRA